MSDPLSLSSLQSSLTRWDWSEYGSAALVLIGVAGESLLELTNVWKDYKHRKRLVIGSALLLVVGLTLELISAVMISSTAGQITAILNKEAGDAKQEAAKAIGSATSAQSKTASLEIEAADAKSHEQKVGVELARQREKTAKAESELLQLQIRFADRTLSVQQRGFLTDQMKPWAGMDIDVIIWGNTTEIEIISGQILSSLADARLHIHSGYAGGGGAVRGILVGAGPNDANSGLAAAVLISSLQSAGLACGPWEFDKMTAPQVLFSSTYTGTAPIRLFIGSKPPN